MTEYWRFDHTGGDYHDAALGGDRLTADGVYERLPINRTPEGGYWGYSAVLELELHWYEGRLRFRNPNTGDYLPDFPELEDRWLATADQLDAAISDRDAYAAAHQATQAQLDDAQAQLAAEAAARQDAEARIRQLEARLAQNQPEVCYNPHRARRFAPDAEAYP